MAMDPGDATANSGMSKAIYEAITSFLQDGIPPAQLPDVQKGWAKLSGAIATGVVNYMKSNLEVIGVNSTGQLQADGKTVNSSQSATGHVQ